MLIGACVENLSMVMEFVVRGSFYDVLHRPTTNTPGDLTWSRSLKILTGAACGMTYLHEQVPPMVHRDLKSLNILV
jgi:serine/threonine protein kinase